MRHLIILVAGLSFASGSALTPAQWGYIDRTGNWVIQPQFSEAGAFDSGGRARVKFVLKEALVDRSGAVRSDTAGTWVETGFSEGLAVVQTGWNLQYGWMDTSGHIVALAVGDKVRQFHCGRAWVQSHAGKWSAVDRGGYERISDKYDAVDDFADGIAAVGLATMTDEGDEETPPTFDWRFGFVDTSGSYLVDPEYEAVRGFTEGRAPVRKSGK